MTSAGARAVATTVFRGRTWSLVVAVAACAGPSERPPATTDAAPKHDAGSQHDARATEDAGDAKADATARRDASAACLPVVARALAPEAGFIELPPQATAASYRARMFYSFRPATTDPSGRARRDAWARARSVTAAR